MQKYDQNLAANNDGALQPLSGASVAVTDSATGLPAALYSDNGTTPLPQPLSTDNNGYFGFYAADGKYTLTFTSSRFATFTRDIVLEDPTDDPYATLAQLSAPTGSTMMNHGDVPVSEVLDELLGGGGFELPIASASALGGVKVGTNLTINEGGALSAPSPGAMVLLGSVTVTSAAAQIDFLNVFSSDYDKAIIELNALQVSASALIYLYFAAAGAVIAGVNYYGPTAPGGTHQSSSQLSVEATALNNGSYTIELCNISVAGNKRFGVRGSKFITNTGPRIAEGISSVTDPLSGFRLAAPGATFISGTVRVYGIKNA